MKKTFQRYTTWLALTATLAFGLVASSASAQVPVQSTSTPTIHGGTPMNGSAIHGEVGYAALRAGFYTGSADQDFGIQLAAPTFGHNTLPGWGQSVGIDLRAPFRFRLLNTGKVSGSVKVGPYFHVGKGCMWGRGGRDRDWDRRGCDLRDIGLGVNFGFVTDIALPKLFKLIVGIEQQLGMLNLKNRDADLANTEFAGATWVDLGLEALWRDMFFTMIMNIGAQYGSNELYYRDHALFRQLFGFGYKFR